MTTKLLENEITRQVQEAFKQLKEPAQVLFFGKKEDCQYCQDTLQLIEEVVALSDKLGLEVHDIDDELALAQQYRIDKTPGFMIAGKDGDQILDYGIRFAGIPPDPPKFG
jgi:thiol-disulfide isomerase/thioredoxin